MANNVPNISLFRKGQRVLMGSGGFGIYGVIIKIVAKDPLPIKVNANMGGMFELSLEDYKKTWFTVQVNEDNGH